MSLDVTISVIKEHTYCGWICKFVSFSIKMSNFLLSGKIKASPVLMDDDGYCYIILLCGFSGFLSYQWFVRTNKESILMVIIIVQLCNCSGFNYCLTSFSNGEDLWQWSWLEIRRNTFHRSTIQKNNSSSSSPIFKGKATKKGVILLTLGCRGAKGGNHFFP